VFWLIVRVAIEIVIAGILFVAAMWFWQSVKSRGYLKKCCQDEALLNRFLSELNDQKPFSQRTSQLQAFEGNWALNMLLRTRVSRGAFGAMKTMTLVVCLALIGLSYFLGLIFLAINVAIFLLWGIPGAFGAAANAALQDILSMASIAYRWKREDPLSYQEFLAQAYGLHKIDAALDRLSGHIFATFGPPGGVGKTTVAINLAVSLSQEESNRVALAELDFRFNDLALLLGVPTEHNLTSLARTVDSLTPEEIEDYLYHHSSGLALLPVLAVPSQVGELDFEDFTKVIRRLRSAFDYVVLDCGPHLNVFTSYALELATKVVIVLATDLPTLKDAELALGLLRSCKVPDERIAVVFNSSSPRSVLEAAAFKDRFGLKVVCSIPYSPEIVACQDSQMSIMTSHPQCEAARATNLLADSLVGA